MKPQPEDDPKMPTTTKPETPQGVDDNDFSDSGDLTGDGGVIKEILQHGEQGWMKPENGDEVYMHYRGTLLEDGSEFDSSYSRNSPFSFKLGQGNVIKGWDVVGKTMAKGEKAKVTLKPEYAYGHNGSPPKIPKDATLVFEMELISWTSQRDVFGDGLVMKTEIESGDGWERPGKMAEVSLDVVVKQMDNDGRKEIKNLYVNKEFVVTLNSHAMPKAWEKIIQDMKKNCITHLICKGDRAKDITGLNLNINEMNALQNDNGISCVRHEIKLLSWRKIEDVSNDGNVMKKVIAEGEGWERPGDGAIATIQMKIWSPDETSTLIVPPSKSTQALFEVSDLEFKVGDGIVIDGVDSVIQSMKLNEHIMACIQPSMGFATAKNLLTDELKQKGITENDKLLIEIKLEKFEKSRDVWSMSHEEKIEEMKQRKKRGNELFKDGRYGTAKKCYDRAINFFDSSTTDLEPKIKTQVNELLVSCHLNLAMCYDRMNDMAKVLNHCKKTLEIQPSNVKALYRQGSAYLALDDFYNAQSSLKYAKELNPGNVDVIRKLKELKHKRLKQDAQDKKLFSNLFGRMTKMEQKESGNDNAATEENDKPMAQGEGDEEEIEEIDASGGGPGKGKSSTMDES